MINQYRTIYRYVIQQNITQLIISVLAVGKGIILTCDIRRGGASSQAGSCDRNGLKAAVLLSAVSSTVMDGTLARFDSGNARSKDDAEALIGRGFRRIDCEYEASTDEG